MVNVNMTTNLYIKKMRDNYRLGIMIEVGWHSSAEKTLKWVFVGKWTAKTFLGALRENRKYLMSVNHSVTVVMDLRNQQGPENILTIVTDTFSYPIYNVEQVIIIGTVAKWQSIYSMAVFKADEANLVVKFVESPSDIQSLL